jgi:26S proteasome regulatory subunit T4
MVFDNRYYPDDFTLDKDLLINWEFLWKYQEKSYEKIKKLEEKVLELDLIEAKMKKDLNSSQDIGQLVGEVIKKINSNRYILKAPTGTRYIVSVQNTVNKNKIKQNTRVALDTSTLTIMKLLINKTDPIIDTMLNENPGIVDYKDIGGLEKQLQQLKEVVELPLFNPEIFTQCGVKTPKGVLLYGPPGTGKTLLARSLSYNIKAKFLKIVASGIVDKYIGESARIIREIFSFAKLNFPCIIFIDEIDAIGGKRFSEGSSADREIQRTLMELLNQMDGFSEIADIKVIMATNRPDVLDPALLRPGRLDRKLNIPLPNKRALLEIFNIYFKKLTNKGSINSEKIIDLCRNFNGADIRNLCTEGGLFAIRDERNFVKEDDLIKAAKKIFLGKNLC